MLKLKLTLSAFILASSIFSTIAAHAATYYVSTTGSNSNPGTKAQPWRTVAHAVNTMVAGDTTYVKGGVYNETSAASFKKSGTESAPIRLMAAPGESPVIDYGSATDYMRRVVLQSSVRLKPIGWIIIEGFEIRNSPVPITLFNAHDTIIRRNSIHHGHAHGIMGNGTNILVDGNVISYNGNSQGCVSGKTTSGRSCNQFHGMYVTGSNWVITNNLIYDNLASGIQVAGYPWCDDGNCYGGGAKEMSDPSYAGAANWLIANNTIAYNNYGPGITVWQGNAVNNKIINNILYENGQSFPSVESPQGINLYNAGGGHIVQNNLFYATGPGGVTAIGGTRNWQSNHTASDNIVNTMNPRFVNAPATLSDSPNFALTAESPSIDKGVISSTKVAIDGTPRPQGRAYDIGAYEYKAGGDSSPPASPILQAR
jgi:hypothetical protein